MKCHRKLHVSVFLPNFSPFLFVLICAYLCLIFFLFFFLSPQLWKNKTQNKTKQNKTKHQLSRLPSGVIITHDAHRRRASFASRRRIQGSRRQTGRQTGRRTLTLQTWILHRRNCWKRRIEKRSYMFLGATKHLYNWLCPSVCLWGNAFVRRSTRRTLLAYLALFFFSNEFLPIHVIFVIHVSFTIWLLVWLLRC